MRVPFAKRRSVPLAIAVTLASAVSNVRAEPAGTSQTLPIGRPQRSTAVALRVASGNVVGRVGSGPELNIPAHGAKELALRALSVGSHAALLAIDTRSAEGEYTTLLGGPHATEVLATVRTDFHGDPGERHAQQVILSNAGVSVATVIEGVTACGPSAVPLQLRHVDEKTLRLGAVAEHSAPAIGAPVQPGRAVAEPTEPALRGLAFASSWLDDNIAMALRPSAVVDGNPDTAVGLRADDFVQVKWPRAENSVERVELWLAAPQSETRAVWLRAAPDKLLAASIPAGARAIAIPLEPAWTSGCFAVGSLGPHAALPLAELRLYTALDRPEFVANAVAKLVQDAPDAALAAEQLADLGSRGTFALAARFDELSTRNQQRALKALSRGLGDPAILAVVLRAAHASDAALSQAALVALYEAGTPSRPSLHALAREPSALGDRAVLLLAQQPAELPALLDAVLAPHGSERPVLRQALEALARRDPARFDAALQARRAGALDAPAHTALAIAAALARHPEAAALMEAALSDGVPFDDRFRMTALSADLGPSPALDAWLAAQSKGAEEWMQRAAAFAALAQRSPAAARELAASVAADPYPRVRAGALAQLRPGADDALLTRAAKDDDWPVVRVAGVEAMAPRPELRGAITGLLDDPSRKVRAAAIGALSRQGAAEAWPQVAARLDAKDEWAEVRVAAVRFAEAQCVAAAREPLVMLARRGLRHDANEDEQFLAGRALEALHALGGEAAADAARIVEREGAPDPLKKMLAQAAPSQCGPAAAVRP